MLRILDTIAARVTALVAVLGTLGLVAEVVVILIDVIGRFFGLPLRGAQDITQMSMLVLVFGGMALCDRIGGHVSVDVFERKFSVGLRRATDIAAALLGAAIFAGIGWNMWKSAAMSAMLNQKTNIINLPFAWFKYFIVLACVITVFGMIVRAVSLILGGALAAHEERVE